MKPLKDWRLAARHATGIDLIADDRHLIRLRVLEAALVRVSVLRDGAWRLDRTWSIAPEGRVPWEGRSRDDLSGFACPAFALHDGPPLTLQTALLRVRVHAPLRLDWAAWRGGAWHPFAADRPTGAVELDRIDHAHAHYLCRHAGERVYGLGEKAGALERSGRRFEMRNLDAMGYDAATTDPLYKHIPFTLTATPAAGCWSIFYDNLAGAWFDLGNELDNYHPPFRSYRAADGDLDYYMRWSPDLAGLVRAQAAMTGGTAFPPRWSLGYSGSTMAYTDAPDAQARLEGFLDRIEAHDIPCDSFQMSSGYTSIGAKRYVFHWNRDKVPDPDALAARFAAAGVRLVANIKPCLLRDHPRHDEAAAAGLFIRDSETGGPETSSFWDDEGAHLDFTNPDTVAWWQASVTDSLLARGIDCTWNDNNEYPVWDRQAQCAGFGRPVDVALIRPLHAILMCRASEDAQRAHAPGRRPYLISRSAAPGLQRHAQTWTGDNRTSWQTLRHNIAMGLGLGLSGFFNIGHDVGGFAGPRPDPELFLRWVQNGIFHPRFTIHSWNDDGSVTEPWMHPEVTDRVRDAIRLRYRLLPYLYTLLWRAVHEHEPILRPTFLDHPDDPGCVGETWDFMLGRDLLVANVVEPGARVRAVRLPANDTGWWDVHAGSWHPGGAELALAVTLDSIPLFARAGAVLPLSRGATRATPDADTGRDLAVYPVPGAGRGGGLLFEDDGETEGGPFSLLHFDLDCTADRLALDWRQAGSGLPVLPRARLRLPAGEVRPLEVRGARAAPDAEVAL